MKDFLKYFFGVLDSKDKKSFKKYILVLFLGSIFSVFGVAAVIPFISILIQPEKVMSYSFFSGLTYERVMLVLTTTLIIAFGIKNFVSFLLLRYQSKFLFGLVAKVQKKLFSTYLSSPYEYHLNRSTPDLIKNINQETSMFANGIVTPLGIMLTETLSSLFVLIILIIISPLFTLLIFCFLILGIIVFMKRMKNKINYYSNMRARVWSSMIDNVLAGLSGIKEVKLYHCESFFLEGFKENVKQLRNTTIFSTVYGQIPKMIIEFMGLSIVMSVVCGFVLMNMDSHNMLLLLSIFGIAAVQLLPALNRTTQSIVNIRYSMPALKTIYEELKIQSIQSGRFEVVLENPVPLKFDKEITVQDLSYTYQDGTKALKKVNIKVAKNKKTAFVGASGAGKTTLVDLLMGLYKPNSGKIFLDDKELDLEKNMHAFQNLFGYIPQQIILYDKSILENVAFGTPKESIDKEWAWKCLQMAQLKDFVLGLKYKEDSRIGEGGIRLSGGQRQRIGIARALYRNPQILVMDEATSALDNQTEREVTEVLPSLKGITILTIAHRLTTIRDYDLIYVLHEGQIASSGSYEDLEKNCQIFSKMIDAIQDKETTMKNENV